MKAFSQRSKPSQKKQASQSLTPLTSNARQSNISNLEFSLIINTLNMEWEALDALAKLVRT